MNIEVDQFSAHVLLLLTNIRKGTKTGRSMLMAMGMYQVTLGCREPFWDVDPDFYLTHSPRDLSLQYLWDKLRQSQATLYIPGMWTPTSTAEGDSCLMDDFVHTARARRGTDAHLKPIQLALANSCRLYLQVTWLFGNQHRGWRPYCALGVFWEAHERKQSNRLSVSAKPPGSCVEGVETFAHSHLYGSCSSTHALGVYSSQ